MSKIKYLLLLSCLLLSACETKPVKLTLLDTKLVTVNYNYSEGRDLYYAGSTGKQHIKLSFLSETAIVAIKGAGVVMPSVYVDHVNEDERLISPLKYAYRKKDGTHQVFQSVYDRKEVDDMEDEFRFDGYLEVEALRPDSTWVNLLEDDYTKLVFVMKVTQTYGVLYVSNEVTITKEQLLKTARAAEPVYIEVPEW